MQTTILIGQLLLVALITGWLLIGVIENIRTPSLNGDLVAKVLSMQGMYDEMPEIHEVLKGNALESPAWHQRIYWLIVGVELIVSAILVVACLLLVGALFGLQSPQSAKLVAIWGTLGFTAIWGAFLVGGQWFHYWCAHKDAQVTHYIMTIWGAVTFIALAAL